MGPERCAGHGDPREHRVPLPDGPVLLGLAELHLPVWVAQRLWMGTLLFAAGAGVLYLCRTIDLVGPGRCVAALAFMFTPYVLQYSGRISVILMPWSGLPWMIAFVMLALRRSRLAVPRTVRPGRGPGQRDQCQLDHLCRDRTGPVAPFRRPGAARGHVGPGTGTWRADGASGPLVSLWWVVGLQVEAAYGVNILKYTETLSSTSSASSPFEILRGLGYWFFYGRPTRRGTGRRRPWPTPNSCG